MADEYRVKLGRGAKFKITLSKKPGEDQEQDQFALALQAARPGLMGTYQPGDEEVWLPQGGYLMNIYDLGQLRVGDPDDDVWQQLDWVHIPDRQFDAITNDYQGTARLTKAQWQTMIDKIFEVDMGEDFETWKNTFRRLDGPNGWRLGIDLILLEKPENYAVPEQGKNFFSAAKDGERPLLSAIDFPGGGVTALPVANSKWTDKGLQLKRAIKIFAFISGGFFSSGKPTNPAASYSFSSGDDSDEFQVKITETNDYDAEGLTEINIKEDIDVYLVPLPGAVRIIASKLAADPLTHWLYCPFETINRDLWAYDDELIAEVGSSPLASQFFDADGQFFPRDVSAARQLTMIDYYKNRPGALYFTTNTDSGVTTILDPTSFNPDPTSFLDIVVNAYDTYEGSNGTGPINDGSWVPLYPGLLMAVMRTKDKTYYLWNNVDSDNNLGAGHPANRNSSNQFPIWLKTIPT